MELYKKKKSFLILWGSGKWQSMLDWSVLRGEGICRFIHFCIVESGIDDLYKCFISQ